MFKGPLMDRVTRLSTMGMRVPDWTGSCSRAYMSPLALVAFRTRAPAVAAP